MRALHAALIATVVPTWFTGSSDSVVHEVAGYAVLALVALRVGWGVFGRGPVRFDRFVRGPRATAAYLQAVAAGAAPRHVGHNPAGGWMVVTLLAVAGAAAATGALYVTDRFWGYGWLAMLHTVFGWGLLALVALHVAGVVVTGRAHRENLAAAMVTGRKRAPVPGDVDA